MGWLMIGLLALITFFNRFAFFSRLTRYQPGAEMGAFLSFSAQSVLTAILAAHRLQLRAGTRAGLGSGLSGRHPAGDRADPAAVADPGGGRRRHGGLLPAALAGGRGRAPALAGLGP